MRNDMHKVIAEPGRRGGHDYVKTRVAIDAANDSEPTREPIRRRGKFDRKNRCQNFNPLRRFLASKVGQQWNDVFSDICASNDLRNKVQGDVREHLTWMVHNHVEVIDGQPFETNGYRIWRDFWVHPDTGVLHAAPSSSYKRRWVRKTEWEQVPIDALTKYVKVDGIWFKVTFKPFIDDEYRAAFKKGDKPFDKDRVGSFDCIFLGSLSRSLDTARRQLSYEWGANICAVSKRQIGSAEIKKMLKARDESLAQAAQLAARKAGKKVVAA